MIQYILECMAFQLLFLIIYDLFLKRETFFQWNRVYLIGTFVLSLFLPWIKIEAFKTTVSSEYFIYPEYLWGMDMSQGVVVSPENSLSFNFSALEIIFYGGMLIAALLFAYKLFQINRLKRQGEIRYFKDFTRVVVRNSNLAFSFFRSIFLGDQVLEKEHQSIIQHELVHIQQRHSWDLLFFELIRIVGWFNPLVHVYQNRVSELHEFIADAKVAKTHKAEQYQLLLSQVFQTQHISFINQFFKSSLTRLNVLGKIISFGSQYGQVKKRIVMLQKSKSKKVWQLKYLLLVPLVAGMLVYTSLEAQENREPGEEHAIGDAQISKKTKSPQIGNSNQDDVDVPFSQVEKVPIFPGCEDADNKTACFQQQMQKHISKNFRYPQEAQEKGIQGRVNIMFLIQKDGSIGNVRMRGPDKILEGEAARIISLLPQMAPGEHKGKKVGVAHSTSITFKLQRQDGYGTIENDDGTVDVPFAVIHQVPIFPGCEDALDKRECFNEKLQEHIRKNFRYPQEAHEKGIEGRVNVLFIIQDDGSIGNVRMRGPDKILEDEAARIISLLPKMVPGEHKGEKVRVPFSIPITFKLEGDNDFALIQNPSLTTRAATYNNLVLERRRLLKKNNTRDPVIINLDQQLKALREQIDSNDSVVPYAKIAEIPVFPGCEDAEDKKACFEEKMLENMRINFKGPPGKERARYNQLRMERYLLLRSLSESNPEIIELDRQLKLLKVKMDEENQSIANSEMMIVSAFLRSDNGIKYIYGTVSNGEIGLPNVNIAIQSKSKIKDTDLDGNFSIEVQKGDIIEFQYTDLPKVILTVTDETEYRIKKIK